MIGKKDNTCVLDRGADCRGVSAKYEAEHHGNLTGANFSNAKLHGADFRGADLTKAKGTYANLNHMQAHGAKLPARNCKVPA